MQTYDLVVIGSGPGGYVCAIKAAQLGLQVAVVEKRATHGGTCLNVGCIPSKALLYASEQFVHVAEHCASLGIDVAKPRVNLKQMMAHKDKCIKANVDGIAYLFKKNKIKTFQGWGRIAGPECVVVRDDQDNESEIKTRAIVIATGSEVAPLPGGAVDIDEEMILSSTGALALSEIPKDMIVIGGGVIGLEMGSVWQRLGTQVTVIEYQNRLLGDMDAELAKSFEKILKKQGGTLHLGTQVTHVEKAKNGGVCVMVKPVAGGKERSITVACVLIATGRRPFTKGLGVEENGISCDKAGRILVNEQFETSLKSVYAIGDAIPGAMLAHKASEEGIALAEYLAGQSGHVDYNVIPSVVYTAPEIASVGKSEEELKREGISYVKGQFPFTANGRAKAMGMTDGFVKILADQKTDRVLGVHILAANAGELIHEAAVLMAFGGSSEDLARVCHAHPTLSEAVREAALATFAQPLHM